MEVDDPEFLMLKSPEVIRRTSYKLFDPYSSSSSNFSSPEERRLQQSADRENALTNSLLSTPIKMQTEDDVYIIDGIPMQELNSGKGESPGSSKRGYLSTESSSKASMSSGSGSGNRKSRMCPDWMRSGHCNYSPCKFTHGDKELLSGIPNLQNTEAPPPSFSSTSASSSLSQFATSYRPFVPVSISYPPLPHQMIMPTAPILQKPSYGSPNTTETGPVQVSQPTGRNKYAIIASAPIKMKPLSEPITLKPVHEHVKVKPPSEHIDIQPSAESKADISVPTSPITPPTFSYWLNPHPDPSFNSKTPFQPINIQTCPTADQPFSDWCPMDDGIQITLLRNNTPSRDEAYDHIMMVLYETNLKKRLPAFENICSSDD